MSKYSYQVINLDITSGITNFEIDIEGDSITHIGGLSDITIRLDTKSSHEIPLSAKDIIKCPPGFKSFFVTASAYAETIKLLVGKPNLIVDAGQVYIAGLVDIGQDRGKWYDSWNDRCFAGWDGTSAVAAELCQFELWNPASSGKWLIIDLVVIRYGTNSNVICQGHNAAIGAGASANVSSKKIKSGTSPVGQLRVDTALATIGGDDLMSYKTLAGESFTVIPDQKIVVPEGAGFVIESIVSNMSADYSVEWTEIDTPT